MVDGFLGYLNRTGDIWFSESLKYGKQLLRASFAAGLVAILGVLASVVSDGDISWNDTGKMSVALFAFSVTAYIVAGIAASVAIAPVVAAVLGAMVAGSIATLTNAFSKEYF
ncbi:MAG: hypothetical protein ACI8SR_000452 [Oceanicoccus sp.]|jgi:hypothetical protein